MQIKINKYLRVLEGKIRIGCSDLDTTINLIEQGHKLLTECKDKTVNTNDIKLKINNWILEIQKVHSS